MQKFAALFVLAVACILGGTLHAQTARDELKPRAVVFAGDNVIAQVVDGVGWKTTFKFVNLENHSVTFTLFFRGDNGQPLTLPILAAPALSYPGGYSTGVTFTLVTAGSATIETAGTGSGLSQGWALMQRANINDSIGGFAIFVTTFGYDPVGNLIKLTDANNHSTQFLYDPVNRPIQETYPDGGVRASESKPDPFARSCVSKSF
jgi:YD repeat-containing protein